MGRGGGEWTGVFPVSDQGGGEFSGASELNRIGAQPPGQPDLYLVKIITLRPLPFVPLPHRANQTQAQYTTSSSFPLQL